MASKDEVEYGYGDCQPDYGYGDGAPTVVDYGYNNNGAAAADHANKKSVTADHAAVMDYGYGDGSPTADPMDYGYGDGSPDEAPVSDPAMSQEDRRPKRRCSVTKYTIENEDQESPLTAHTRINEFRNGSVVVVEDDAAAATPSTTTTLTTASPEAAVSDSKPEDGRVAKKKGMMHRIRKRLSIV
jgi:hypothetical protein